jgi:hypothetical protein
VSDPEYLPAESETLSPVPAASGGEIEKPLLRVQCDGCSKEQGARIVWDDMVRLLEALGWKIGREILCPDCIKKRAREFLNKYQ